MTVITPPLFQTVDGAYQGRHLGIPYRDILTEGVVGVNDLKVSQRGAGANLSVDVAAGVAWVSGDDNTATQPLYRVYNDATVNLAISTAHGTNPRIDIVVAEVRDSAFSGVNQDWRLRVIDGTPAGSPVAPSTPNNCLKLAEVSVPALDTTISDSQITDKRPYVFPNASVDEACRVWRSTTQAIATGSVVQVAWDSEVYDPLGMHSTSSNTERIYVKSNGLYVINAHIYFEPKAGGGNRLLKVTKNGTTDLRTWLDWPGTQEVVGGISCTEVMAAGDYVDVRIVQTSGTSLNVSSTDRQWSNFEVVRVG